jgi:hypothetical protein
MHRVDIDAERLREGRTDHEDPLAVRPDGEAAVVPFGERRGRPDRRVHLIRSRVGGRERVRRRAGVASGGIGSSPAVPSTTRKLFAGCEFIVTRRTNPSAAT